MGVDYEYCSRCEECLNEYSFNSCIICEERCNYCDECDDDYLITLNKEPRLLCDCCSLGFDKSDPHIDLYIGDISKDNKMFKYAVIKVLQTEHEKRTKIKIIEKLESEVEILKVAINNQYAIIGIEALKNSL